ncbi:MAG: RdgB/HAM1 family non-canonical purine NTP pyrophosphatase [Tissierellia bacterium]|nr:RdgB/HAM1 family non-canonical purine NTP pyrophosphatase [Tissierellia bacterium]
MKKLIISTGNKDKVNEIKYILKDLNIEVLSKNEIGLSDLDVEEDADTLEGNAEKKADAIYEKYKAAIVADDTGLYVDSLGGMPGVHTARYAGDDADYEDNRKKLLSEMSSFNGEKRKARFITAIVLVESSGKKHIAKGICEGYISEEERGNLGFGYDPIFIPEGYDETFAELSPDIKNRISHRALALKELRFILEKIVGEKDEDCCN